MRRRSPGSTSTVANAGSSSPFSRLRPGRPSPPPLSPRGASARRWVRSERRHAFERSELADDAVAASVLARAAGAEPQLVALDPERVRELERLDRRVQRVRHRDVHRGRPVRVRARALPAADRLVVREALVPEDDVVHRPLPLRRDGNGLRQRGEDDVDDAARRLRVAGGDRGRRARVDEAALGRAHGHGLEGAARGGEVGSGEAADDVEARRARHRERAVQVPVVLRRRAFEVDLDRVAGDRHGRADLEQARRSLERVGAGEAPVRQLARSPRARPARSTRGARPSPPRPARGRGARRAPRRGARRGGAPRAGRAGRRDARPGSASARRAARARRRRGASAGRRRPPPRASSSRRGGCPARSRRRPRGARGRRHSRERSSSRS